MTNCPTLRVPLPPEVCHHFVLSPCRHAEDAADDDDDDGARGHVEVCRADEAELWTVYAMRPSGEFMIASTLLDCAALADAALALLLCGAGAGRPVAYQDAAFGFDEADPAELAAALAAAMARDDPLRREAAVLAPVRQALLAALAVLPTRD